MTQVTKQGKTFTFGSIWIQTQLFMNKLGSLALWGKVYDQKWPRKVIFTKAKLEKMSENFLNFTKLLKHE